jgi:hypothetical protein
VANPDITGPERAAIHVVLVAIVGMFGIAVAEHYLFLRP